MFISIQTLEEDSPLILFPLFLFNWTTDVKKVYSMYGISYMPDNLVIFIGIVIIPAVFCLQIVLIIIHK